MKEYSTFINTGRGAQVVEEDLSKVLRKKPSICALLDVSQHEPPFPWSPLLRRKNLFLSPHIAGSTGKEYDRMVEYTLRAYEDYVEQRSNDLEVTMEMLDKMA
jgi:phosphoglycerate dehydrogenase-like enzyme